MKRADTITVDNQLNFAEFYQVHTGETLPASYTPTKAGFNVLASNTKGRYSTDYNYNYLT